MNRDNDRDLRQLFHNARLPETDLTQPVMKKLLKSKAEKGRGTLNYRVSVFVLVGMLLTVSSAFAAVHLYSLTNHHGDIVYEEKQIDPADRDGNTLENQLRSLQSGRLADQLLKEGEVAAFYMAEGNPDRKIDIERAPVRFKTLSALREKLKGQPIRIMETVAGQKYKFESARVIYSPDELSDEEWSKLTDQLEKQAEESGKGYAMQTLRVSGDHWNLFSVYEHGGNKLLVQATKSDEKTVVMQSSAGSEGVKKEKLNVDGAELLYSEYTTVPGKEISREIATGKGISFIYSIPDSKFYIWYHIEDVGGHLSKQELIDLAQAYLK